MKTLRANAEKLNIQSISNAVAMFIDATPKSDSHYETTNAFSFLWNNYLPLFEDLKLTFSEVKRTLHLEFTPYLMQPVVGDGIAP